LKKKVTIFKKLTEGSKNSSSNNKDNPFVYEIFALFQIEYKPSRNPLKDLSAIPPIT